MATILVTGGCGFLGSHIVDALIAEHYTVVAASRNPTRNINPSARYVACDITNDKTIASLIGDVRPACIIHTVTSGPMAAPAAQRRDYLATKNLVELAQSAGSVKAFIYSGSAEALSNSSGLRSTPLSESDAVLHSFNSGPTGYSNTKAASEALILGTSSASHKPTGASPRNDYSGSLRTTVLRMPGIYGPRDPSITSGLLQGTNTLVSRIQLGDNKPFHEWVYAENAAHAYVLATKALLAADGTGVDGEAFFITDGKPVKFWDFTRKLWAAAGDKNQSKKPIVIPWGPLVALATMTEVLFLVFTFGRVLPPMSRHHLQYMRFGAWWDIAKARDKLQYEPLVDTDVGISRAVAWFREKGE